MSGFALLYPTYRISKLPSCFEKRALMKRRKLSSTPSARGKAFQIVILSFLLSFLTSSFTFAEEPPALLSAPVPTPAQIQAPVELPTVKIEGTLWERGTKKPLSQVNIYCFPESSPEKPIKIVTNKTGKFSAEIPEGKFRWVISVSGYQRLEQNDEQLLGRDNKARTFYLEKVSYLTYETTVYGRTEKRDDKTESLSQAQFLTVPGANGDPVKAVQNLPGVNRTSAFSSQIIIEGSSPNDTRYNIDNQPVPIIFHFGGLSSVVMPEAVDHVDYLSAGFGPEFGQTIAGLVNLTVKDPQTDRDHGFVYADFMNAGGMIEGPLNDHSSYLVGVRQSYIGAVLGVVARSSKDNKNFELTAAPDFKDTVLEYKNQVSSKDTFKVVGVGSQDTFAFLLKQPADQDPSIRGNFNLRTDFFRIIPEWTHQYSPDVTGRISLGTGKDTTVFDLGDFYARSEQLVLTGRAELEDQINSTWKSYWGADIQKYWLDYTYQLPVVYNQGGVSNPIGSGTLTNVARRYAPEADGLYWRNVIHPPDSRWTFLPGVRYSYFNMTKESIVEPRIGARYALDHGWTLRAAGGLYNEAPPTGDLDATYGNPGLKSQRAVHGSAGFEKDFRDGSATGWTITNDFFYKYLYDLVASSTAFLSPSRPEYYNNSGFGHIYGLEFLGKFRSLTWEGWVSYTYSRSTRGDNLTPETLAQYDQTHLLTLVADKELGKNWKISTRIRYATGNLYTPVVGSVFDVDNDVYTPIRGDIYSQRMGDFFQADVRFDKKWVYDKWILTGYLDIENVTNRQNPQQINYSYNYQQSATVTGLPLFPTLGVKAEF